MRSADLPLWAQQLPPGLIERALAAVPLFGGCEIHGGMSHPSGDGWAFLLTTNPNSASESLASHWLIALSEQGTTLKVALPSRPKAGMWPRSDRLVVESHGLAHSLWVIAADSGNILSQLDAPARLPSGHILTCHPSQDLLVVGYRAERGQAGTAGYGHVRSLSLVDGCVLGELQAMAEDGSYGIHGVRVEGYGLQCQHTGDDGLPWERAWDGAFTQQGRRAHPLWPLKPAPSAPKAPAIQLTRPFEEQVAELLTPSFGIDLRWHGHSCPDERWQQPWEELVAILSPKLQWMQLDLLPSSGGIGSQAWAFSPQAAKPLAMAASQLRLRENGVGQCWLHSGIPNFDGGPFQLVVCGNQWYLRLPLEDRQRSQALFQWVRTWASEQLLESAVLGVMPRNWPVFRSLFCDPQGPLQPHECAAIADHLRGNPGLLVQPQLGPHTYVAKPAETDANTARCRMLSRLVKDETLLRKALGPPTSQMPAAPAPVSLYFLLQSHPEARSLGGGTWLGLCEPWAWAPGITEQAAAFFDFRAQLAAQGLPLRRDLAELGTPETDWFARDAQPWQEEPSAEAFDLSVFG